MSERWAPNFFSSVFFFNDSLKYRNRKNYNFSGLSHNNISRTLVRINWNPLTFHVTDTQFIKIYSIFVSWDSFILPDILNGFFSVPTNRNSTKKWRRTKKKQQHLEIVTMSGRPLDFKQKINSKLLTNSFTE